MESQGVNSLNGATRVDFDNTTTSETLRITTNDQTFSGIIRTEDAANHRGTIEVATGIDFTLDGATGLQWLQATGDILKTGAGNLVLDAAGSGTGELIVNRGLVRLTNTPGSEPISGDLTIGDGTGGAGADIVRLGAADQIADTSAVSLDDSGLLDLNDNNETIGSLATLSAADDNANVDLGSATLTVGDATSTGYEGIITGTGSVIKAGTGTLTLSGSNANTYSGNTTVNAGTLILDKTAGVDSIAGDLTIGNGAGTDTVQLMSVNQIANTSALSLDNSGVFDLNDFNERIGSLATLSTLDVNANVFLGSATLTVGDGTSTEYSGIITGTGSVTKIGSGNLTLSGTIANTYSGNTTVNAGTLILNKTAGTDAVAGDLTIGNGAGTDTVQLSAANQIADTSAVTVNASGVLDLNDSDETIGSLAGVVGAQVTLGTGGDLTVGDSTSTTFAGVISETGSLTKTGSGRLTLSENNTYSGATSINGGFLQISDAGALGDATGDTTVSTGGTLELTNGISVVSGESLTLSGTGNGGVGALRNVSGSNTWAGAVDLDAAATIASDAGTLTISGTVDNDAFLLTVDGAGDATISGVVSDTGGLTKDGNGTLTLSGGSANTFSGLTTVNTGTVLLNKSSGDAIAGNLTIGDGAGTDTVQLSVANQIADTSAVSFDDSGVFDLNDFNETIGSLATLSAADDNANVDLGSATLTVGDGTSTGYEGIITGTGSVTKVGAGSLTLSGTNANTYSGATTVSEGTLILSKTAGVDAVAGDLTIGSGAGTDTVRLATSNQINNSSDITFNGGVLEMNGNSDSVGTVDVNLTSTVDFAGNPAATISSLTFADSSAVSWNAAALFQFDNWDGLLAGSGDDRLVYSGGGVSEDQLSQHRFLNYDSGSGSMTHLANLLGSGEVVPLSGNEFIWQPTGGGDWNTGSNWNAGSDPDNIFARATIGNSITTNATISAATEGAINLNRLTFDSTAGNDVTLNNTIDFTFSNDGTTDPQIVVDAGETGDYTIAGGVALSDDLTVNQGGSGTLTISGTVSETSAGQTMTKSGSGELVLSGTNTFTGNTTISAGIVSISADSGLGTAPGAATAGHLTFGGGTLNSTATFTLNSNRGIQLNAGGGTIETDASTTLTYGGTMAGTGNFAKSGSGTLVLSTSNTYTGGT